jgi:hypothetical protein
MKPYITEELWALSPTIEPQYDEETQVITIDNFYENPDDIYEHLMSRPVPMWKYNSERKNSRNGIDYNDCRVVDTVGHPTRLYTNSNERIKDICRQHFWKGEYSFQNIIEVNCFQTLTVFDNKLQHYPHIDSELSCPDLSATLNMLVYLDKEDDGGTAIYGGEWIHNDEQKNLLYPVENDFTVEHIIPAKFNRCVIFPGNRLHGAWIDDYSKFTGDKWRYTLVRFFHPWGNPNYNGQV